MDPLERVNTGFDAAKEGVFARVDEICAVEQTVQATGMEAATSNYAEHSLGGENMGRLSGFLLAGGVAMAALSPAVAQKSGMLTGTDAATVSGSVPEGMGIGTYGLVGTLPRGTSTVIGGVIRDVDPVRDKFTLRAFGGGHPMKVLFDERTEVYRDGVRIRLADLHSEDHASVETVLDGTDVFAVSIHMLSQAMEGEARGHVVSYDAGTGELTVRDALSHATIKLRVVGSTRLNPIGQAANVSTSSSGENLVNGTLIGAKFEPDQRGGGVAKQIDILAVPGMPFQFAGEISFVDLHSNVMVIVDPRDDKSYKIDFNAAQFPMSAELREGQHVRVTATFDGTRYTANAMATY